MLTCQVIGLHGQFSVPEFGGRLQPNQSWTYRLALISSWNERIAECWCSWNNVCITDCTWIRSIDSNNGCCICIWNCFNLMFYCITNPICCCTGWPISFRRVFKSRYLIGLQASNPQFDWLRASIWKLFSVLSMIHEKRMTPVPSVILNGLIGTLFKRSF